MTQVNYSKLSMVVLTAAAMIMLTILPAIRVDALSSSSLTLSDSRPSQTGVTYTFDTSSVTATSAQCFELILNDQADGAGTAVGTTTAYTLGTSTGFYSVDSVF